MSNFNSSQQKRQIDNLVDHVYGPYDDFSFFDPKRFPPAGCIPCLTDVEMYFNKEQIGFDDSEYINTPPAGSSLQNNQDILLAGVIEIDSLDWLLPAACKELERDVRKHDNDIHSTNGRSTVTLQSIYGIKNVDNGPRLQVRIMCVKRMLATNLSRNYPGIFLVSVATENRNFFIRSMEKTTLDRSRLFIQRSNLRLLLKKLVEEDENKTPLHKRDYSWIMDRYYGVELPAAKDPSLRYNKPVAPFPELLTEPRRIRHLPRAAFRGLLAEHAEWLLAVQLATLSKNAQLIDIPSWINFCREAKEDSLDARKSGYVWGIFHSIGIRGDLPKFGKLSARLARFGDTQTEWEKRLKNALKRADKQKNDKSPSPAPDVEMEPPPNTFQFDSDFSEASSEYDSDMSSELDFMPSGLPPYLFEPPILQGGSFDWHCPAARCSFSIDLLSVPTSLLSKLPLPQQHFLKSKQWNVTNTGIQSIFHTLVSDHYETHLSELGFSLSQTGINDWKLQRNSEPSPKGHKIKKEDSNRGLMIP